MPEPTNAWTPPKVMNATLRDDDREVVRELAALTGQKDVAALGRMGLRALLREQRRAQGLPIHGAEAGTGSVVPNATPGT